MLNEIYTQQILASAANIPFLGRLKHPQATATAHSRLCGSTIIVDLVMEGAFVTEFSQEVKACALGQAAASIVGGLIIGSSAEEVRQIRDSMLQMLKGEAKPPTGKWEPLAALEPIRDYPARHTSVMLVFDAIMDAISQIEQCRAQKIMPALSKSVSK